MAKTDRVASTAKKIEEMVEGNIDKIEAKKDMAILGEITDALPSLSKVRIYKKDEEGDKSFIAAISAEDFDRENPHEWIKNKYKEKHGGGSYIVELVDSNGKPVHKGEVNIASTEDEKKTESPDTYVKHIDKSMEIREKAMEKSAEAEEKLREAEKTKYETALDTLSKQWETITKLYDTRIADMQAAKDKAPEAMQMYYQSQIDNLKRDLDYEKRRIEGDIASKKESSTAVDKMFDLVNQLMPMILTKRDGDRDPMLETQKLYEFVNTVTGGKKDVIESMIENPDRMKIFQKLLGISDEKKEEKPGFFEDMLEKPEKMEMFKKMMGLDRKDFFSEMIENPQKFDMLKKLMGVDDITEIVRSRAETPPVQPKSALDEVLESATKIDQLKKVFGTSQPVKSFIELLGSLAQNLGPHIVNSVQSVMNNMVTIEAIRKGLVKEGHFMPGYSGAQEPAPQIPNEGEENMEIVDKTQKKSDNIEEMFEKVVVNVAVSQPEGIEPEDFINKVSTIIVNTVKKRPSLIIALFKLGNEETIKNKMSEIIIKNIGVEEPIALEFAGRITEKVVLDMKT